MGNSMMDASKRIAEDLLRSCVLRVEVSGEHQGTGFAVAPGLVATCFHVVESALLPDGRVPITLSQLDEADQRKTYAVAHVRRRSQDDDLVLLQAPDAQHLPVVLLDGAYTMLDPVHTFGFPGDHGEGAPTNLMADGRMGGASQWLKFSGGQVQRGMSGSPVLNMNTGAVCGILKRTRDESQSLGGYAIPITTLFALDADLEDANQRYHASGSDWFDAMSSGQRQAWKARRGPMVSRQAESRHLIVRVGPKPDGWRVSAQVQPGGDKVPLESAASVDLTTVRTEVARLFGDWASRGRVPEGEQIRLLGTILFTALFPPEISACFESLLKEHRDGQVHISLQFEEGTDPYLINLPWEDLYRPEDSARAALPLAAAGHVSFARTLLAEPEDPGSEDRLSEVASALLMAVRPKPMKDAATAEHVLDRALTDEVAQALLKTAGETPGFQIKELEGGDAETLVEELTGGGYDILHYVGFGAFLEGEDQLAVEGETIEGAEFLTIDDLLLNWQSPPKLVMLQMCRGPSGFVPADFGILAQAVLKREVAAVVAWQHPLDPQQHAEFNAAFYRVLLQGESVQMAVQRGRQTLLGNRWTRAFVAPALFMREPRDLRLVHPRRAPAASPAAVSYAGLASR
jgi:trypsin-like peptidase/CHAT domain-containing protein